MRLLKRHIDGSFRHTDLLFDKEIAEYPYAVLSHRWGNANDEVTFEDLVAGLGKDKDGYRKIQFCGDQAAKDGLEYFWADSCCIKKSSDAELTEAINSMYRWYSRAAKCYVYLSDVPGATFSLDDQSRPSTTHSALGSSEWFLRGWTLQELLAPPSVEFFSRECERLGDKDGLGQVIHEITGIDLKALQGTPMSHFSIDQRFEWAKNRITTREEDWAYSLLGIFGVSMPLVYGEGRERAIIRLRKEISETSSMGFRLIGSKPVSNIPFRRDPDYVDRGDILDQVHQRCSQPAGRAALVGLGGVGKSQLAIEYAYRVGDSTPNTWVFWVHASNLERFEAAYRDIAATVGLLHSNESRANLLEPVTKWLSNGRNGRWLMIVDNVDDLAALKAPGSGSTSQASVLDSIPQSSNGAILITSRSADIAREITDREQDIIRVDAMTQQEAVYLLQNKLLPSRGGQELDLVTALDRIPLAITQAAAYINRQPRMIVSTYLELLAENSTKAKLLVKAFSDLRRDNRDQKASNSILSTLQMTFEEILAERSSAAHLLSLMSYFNRQGIPESMLRQCSNTYGEMADQETAESHGSLSSLFDADIALLIRFSLATTTEDGYAMHGLVQLATHAWLSITGTEKLWWNIYVRAIAAIFPAMPYDDWSRSCALLPHIQRIVERRPPADISQSWILLLMKAGSCFFTQDLFAQAEELALKMLEEIQNSLGLDPGWMLSALHLLISILQRQGRYQEAESTARRALALCTKAYGDDHYETAVMLNELVEIIRAQGRRNEADAINRQVLIQRKNVLGPEHSNTLQSMDVLATTLQLQGKYEEAEAICRKILAIRQRELGPGHGDTLDTLQSLGIALQMQGKFQEATLVLQQHFVIMERERGRDNPLTLSASLAIATTMLAEGTYHRAEMLNRELLPRLEQELGPKSSLTLLCMYNLACASHSCGELQEAVTLMELCLERYEQTLGSYHSSTQAAARKLRSWRDGDTDS